MYQNHIVRTLVQPCNHATDFADGVQYSRGWLRYLFSYLSWQIVSSDRAQFRTAMLDSESPGVGGENLASVLGQRNARRGAVARWSVSLPVSAPVTMMIFPWLSAEFASYRHHGIRKTIVRATAVTVKKGIKLGTDMYV